MFHCVNTSSFELCWNVIFGLYHVLMIYPYLHIFSTPDKFDVHIWNSFLNSPADKTTLLKTTKSTKKQLNGSLFKGELTYSYLEQQFLFQTNTDMQRNKYSMRTVRLFRRNQIRKIKTKGENRNWRLTTKSLVEDERP